MIRNDQVYMNPNLWPVFPPSKYSPIFSPLPYPTFPSSPDLFTVFFFHSLPRSFDPLYAADVDDRLMNTFEGQKTHCNRLWCESQLWSTSFTEPIHHGTLWGPRVNPWGTLSLFPWHCICIWHSMGFRWNERDTTIFTWSYMNAMHQSNPISASLVTKVTDWQIVVTLVLQCHICAGVPVFISGNFPPVCVYQAWRMMSRAYLSGFWTTDRSAGDSNHLDLHNTGG